MSRTLKILGYGLVGVVVLLGVAATATYVGSNARLKKAYTVSPRAVAIPTDATALARGRHLAETRGCNDCHGKDYAGSKVIDDGAMGLLHAPNLTRGRGSRVATFTDTDWVRAIRHGVGPDQRGLILMPSEEYSEFSDDDLGAIIAFVKALPPVDRDLVPIALGPVSRVLLATGKMKLGAEVVNHTRAQPKAMTIGVSPEYGRYVAASCTGCHGPNLAGGKIDIGPPSWPEAANLTPHASGRLSKWTETDFVNAIRTAKRPDGTELSPVMPRGFGQMDDTELKAIWAYLKTVPAVATGMR